MKTLSRLFWLSLMALFFIFKVSVASDQSSNSDNEGTEFDEHGADQQDDQHAQVEEYDFMEHHTNNHQADNLTPEGIMHQIIVGFREDLPRNVLPYLNDEQLSYLLMNPTGARLAAQNYYELLPNMIGFINVDAIDTEFFVHLAVFRDQNILGIDSIPALMIANAVKFQSMYKKLNLNGFIRKLDQLNHEVSHFVDQVFLLPHLFNFPTVINPQTYLGKGMELNPDQNGTKTDFIIWNISLQLFIFNLLNVPEFAASEHFQEIVGIVKAELDSAHQSVDETFEEFKYNYFGMIDNPIFSCKSVFNTETPLTLQQNAITINQLSASVGLPSYFASINYDDLSTDMKIVYRLLVYVAIFNPSILQDFEIHDIATKIINEKDSEELTEAELYFFATACLNRNLSSTIVKISRNFSTSRFRAIVMGIMERERRVYDSITRNTSTLGDFLFLTGTNPREPLNNPITMTNENYYKTIQKGRLQSGKTATSTAEITASQGQALPEPPRKSKRRLFGENKSENPLFNSHFLSENHLRSVGKLNTAYFAKTFVVPYPNKEFFEKRIDHLFQNLNEADGGEAKWTAYVSSIEDEELREQYERKERLMDEFVVLTFRALYLNQKNPNALIKIYFSDSPGVGGGVTGEAIGFLSRIIILPKYKVFYYSPKIFGFVPYPLLHPEIMGVLGFMNSWFIKSDAPTNWHLPANFIKFLFYEEDTNESLQGLIENLYPELFAKINGLLSDLSNPLDYFPTTFKSHQPLAFVEDEPVSPFDLFEPLRNLGPNVSSFAEFLDAERSVLLDEVINVKRKRVKRSYEESKGENLEMLAESKENDNANDNPIQSENENNGDEEEEIDPKADPKLLVRYFEQLKLKKQIVGAIKHACSSELIDHLLMGRFCFMRQFLTAFNDLSQAHINAQFYNGVQLAQNKEFEVKDILIGLNYEIPRNDLRIFDNESQEYMAPKQILEKILRSYTPKLLRSFYWFCTGCFSLPLSGLDKKPIQVQVSDYFLLPSAATCFRIFRFHTRGTYDENYAALYTAITETSGYQFIENRDQIPGQAPAQEPAQAQTSSISNPIDLTDENADI